MTKTRLSSKGQVIIPAQVRAAHHWEAGQELTVVDAGDGVLLKPRSAFEQSCLDELAGCLRFEGPAKSQQEMEEAIRQGAMESLNDCG